MVSINIELTDELAKIVDKQVKGGLYADASDYIRGLIREEMEENFDDELRISALKDTILPRLKNIENQEDFKMSFNEFISGVKN